MYFRIGNYIYFEDPDAIGLITLCGEIVMGVDDDYIEWYA